MRLQKGNRGHTLLSNESSLGKAEPNLEHLLAKIDSNESSLKEASGEFENQFIQILELLENFRKVSEGLNDSSDLMLSMSRSEDNPVRSVNESLCPHLDFIEQSAQSFRSLICDLSEDSQKIDHTLSHEKKLDQTFSQLTYIRTLFRVESAPLEDRKSVV